MVITQGVQSDESASRLSGPAPIVHVIDGERSARDSLEWMIRRQGWQPIAAASAEEFLLQPPPLTPSCVITEVTLPGMSGLELQKQIRPLAWLPVIFVSGAADIPTTVRAMKCGALEFLTKPLFADSVLGAVKAALDRSETALRRHCEMRALQEHYESLSPREREVMALVVAGCLNKQIAAELGISEITVKAHRGRVMCKMAADSLAALVHMDRTLGLPRRLCQPTAGRHRAERAAPPLSSVIAIS
jgi:FixJ family two-component response regulator